MRIRRRLTPFLLLAFAAVPLAHAQDAAQSTAKPAQDGNIVVTGQAQKPIRKAQRYISQVLDVNGGQLARFVDPVCPLVIGLKPAFNEMIADRFRVVASASSVRMAKAKCQPNLMIVFASNGDALVETMRKQRNAAFEDLDDGAMRDAFKSGPVHAWRLVVTRDEVGHISTANDDPDYPPVMEGETQAATINAVIVIDRKAAQGKSVKQIADYAAMRTLVGARPPEKDSIKAASILSLFDPAVAPPPAEISDMDLGLLAGLYRMRDPSEPGRDQAYRISRVMTSGKQH